MIPQTFGPELEAQGDPVEIVHRLNRYRYLDLTLRTDEELRRFELAMDGFRLDLDGNADEP